MITAAKAKIDAFITGDDWGLIIRGGNAASNQAKQIQTEKRNRSQRKSTLLSFVSVSTSST